MRRPLYFFFSFRSPYCWIAFRELGRRELSNIDLIYYPIYPPSGEDFLGAAKSSYIHEDMSRIALRHGLTYRPPALMDVDWVLPHSMMLAAQLLGRGQEFGEEVFRSRFSLDRDIGSPEILCEIAESVGLDGKTSIGMALDAAIQERIQYGFTEFRKVDGFGVPLIVFNGERFWGQDRLDFVFERIMSTRK